MNRDFYLGLAADGHRMPIGTHLVLHEHPDPKAIELDGRRLGEVVAEAARRFGTPLAVPLMDLKLEKEAMLAAMGIPANQIDSYHFDEETPLPEPDDVPVTARMAATCEAIRHVSTVDGLVPLGMCIGPFSLMTKLVSDPITPVFMAGTGLTGEDDPEVEVIERCLRAGLHVVLQYIGRQLDSGAKAIIVCEPAANLVYLSPKQLDQSFELFDRFVMDGLTQIRKYLRERDADLILHDCGELTDGMVARFDTLDAAMLSLGCSRKLWDDAALISHRTVLYGNLPTKKFYSPELTISEVERLTCELLANMRMTGHPFILGSECDILSVPGSEREILAKVEAFLKARPA